MTNDQRHQEILNAVDIAIERHVPIKRRVLFEHHVRPTGDGLCVSLKAHVPNTDLRYRAGLFWPWEDLRRSDKPIEIRSIARAVTSLNNKLNEVL